MSAIRPKIGIGYRVGMLTVEGKTGKRKNAYAVWKCRCDCGGYIDLDTRTLQRCTIKDCGCTTKVRPGTVDLTGMRFGKLLCIEQTDMKDRSGNILWRCQCDCGNTCLAAIPYLKSGYKKSCGCLSHPPLKDFVGKRFGMLTVLEYSGKVKGLHQWKCRCDCGKETIVGQTRLQNGTTRDCGCQQTANFMKNLGVTDGTSVSMLEHYKTHLSSRNVSGYNGVYRDDRNAKWVAQIAFKGKKQYIGSFENIEDAIAARQEKEREIDCFLEAFYANNPEWKRGKNNSMNKKELVKEISKRSNIARNDAEKALNTFCEIVSEELVANRKVQIFGFGCFEVRERVARTGINPITGESIEIEASRLPAFKAGKSLRDTVNA